MAAPTPKPPEERINRAKPRRGEWIDLDKPELDKDEIVLPELGSIQRSKLNYKALSTWRVWRREPVTTYWTAADIKAAQDILELYNVKDWTRNAAEIRQRETALALNPKGKRDLRFRITFGVGKEATKEVKLPENVISMDARRQNLGHGA
jgi:hypothetical protein